MPVNKNDKLSSGREVGNLQVNNMHYQSEFLPTHLIGKIENELFNLKIDYRTKNNYLKCIGIIHYHQTVIGDSICNYVPLGRTYWKKIFGGDYHGKVIAPLLTLNILERVSFGERNFQSNPSNYRKGKVVIRYRINPLYLNSEFASLSYFHGQKLTTPDEVIFNHGENFIIDFKNQIFHVGIEKINADKWLAGNIDRIIAGHVRHEYVKQLPDDYKISCIVHNDDNIPDHRYFTLKKAKELAQFIQKDFFFFKDNFRIANLKDFLHQTTVATTYRYVNSISRIEKMPFIEKRSATNLRLHSDLVNFPSRLLPFITINAQPITQIDLKTSQFLLLANLLNLYCTNGKDALLKLFKKSRNKSYIKKFVEIMDEHSSVIPQHGIDIVNCNLYGSSSSDILTFIKDVFYHDFYEIVKNKLKLEDRGLAKLTTFKLLFRQDSAGDPLLDELATHYRVVFSIISSFKKQVKKGDSLSNEHNEFESNFSVFLQCLEAEIFIDYILYPLREKNIPCFSRHDSIITTKNHEEEVEKYIRHVFTSMGFRCNLMVEDNFWESVDWEELENAGYLDWLIGENDLVSEYIDTEKDSDKNDKMIEETKNFDDELELNQKLVRMGLKEDYFDDFDIELLEELAESNLPKQYKDILYDEVILQRDGERCGFQTETNFVIHQIVRSLLGKKDLWEI